ncbi:MAG: polyhydroxyalkanoate depolymerase, partial [Sphingomonadales bacterium]
MAPARIAADMGQRILRHPFNPASYTPAGRAIAASLDLFEHTTRRYGKPAFDLPVTEIDGKTVTIVEELHARKNFGQLRHFRRALKGASAHKDDPRVLVVAPMSGHHATLLRDTVRTLLPDHDVYITDWRDARNVPVYEGLFDLDDYIDYVIEWLEFLGPNTHVIAVCQPSVPVLAAVSLMAAKDH